MNLLIFVFKIHKNPILNTILMNICYKHACILMGPAYTKLLENDRILNVDTYKRKLWFTK